MFKMAARLLSRVVRLKGQRNCKYPNRSLCSVKAEDNDITKISLTDKLPGLPTPQYAKATCQSYDTHITTLDNGLRIASENKFGQFCTVGILLESGSRFEALYPSGIVHFLEKMSFGPTPLWSSKDKILQELEKVGGICDCQGSRDTLVYAASARTYGLESVMNILSDVVLRPVYPDEQIEDARQAIRFEIEAMHMDPNPEQLLVEMIHAAAYRSNTLGLPRVCPEENTDIITRQTLYSYMKGRHHPKNAVIAGVGVDHEKLVSLAQKYFVEQKTPVWLPDGEVWGKQEIETKCISQYTGGILQVEKDLSNVSLGPTPMPELAHVVFGLESCSHKDPDFIAFCVLNMMLGGGGSFSAGGPGKGMYTRLYLNVLNRHVWIENATAYNHAYEDSGLFCIHASAHPSKLRELVEVIIREIVFTTSMVYPEELNRAKRQLQSMLMMNLEVRPVVFEDIGRQVLAGSVRRTPQYYYDQIGNISERDIQRVASRMIKSKLSVAAYGSLSGLPSYEDMETAVLSKDGRLPSKQSFSFFRR
ncbi:mitochondrial-processing peptidase subunit alpha-like [Biomphalaria glabrata]|uniref:Mitochondrial-processing peptidase subunit alpha n=1 Tax=Biomphalaria glabrata TaxID=6526 RepID=A0A2C9K120_BIOGL|nr:mitochondrial-processing peptidase subunit alpha-like [Biomphalaria glabrata]KAI8758715.1 mitochondrial-processing peptidase subunit alpha-like [Biomphalaria glabrata]KAI8792225.1 mitochondrial-processing peptidase subunit alpha [Biomphalaria glabrata]